MYSRLLYLKLIEITCSLIHTCQHSEVTGLKQQRTQNRSADDTSRTLPIGYVTVGISVNVCHLQRVWKLHFTVLIIFEQLSVHNLTRTVLVLLIKVVVITNR